MQKQFTTCTTCAIDVSADEQAFQTLLKRWSGSGSLLIKLFEDYRDYFLFQIPTSNVAQARTCLERRILAGLNVTTTGEDYTTALARIPTHVLEQASHRLFRCVSNIPTLPAPSPLEKQDWCESKDPFVLPVPCNLVLWRQSQFGGSGGGGGGGYSSGSGGGLGCLKAPR